MNCRLDRRHSAAITEISWEPKSIAIERLLHSERSSQQPNQVLRSAALTASAVASARWTSGLLVAASTWSATLCIVLVQSKSMSAPAALHGCGRAGQEFAGLLPLPAGLEHLNLGKVNGHQHALRRVKPA